MSRTEVTCFRTDELNRSKIAFVQKVSPNFSQTCLRVSHKCVRRP